jgi:fatty acid desaturase (delta-4 desaturase)
MDPKTIQVENHLYDTDEMAQIHPGGELFIKAFSGQDASIAFLSYHRRYFPHDKYKHLQRGNIDSVFEKDPDYIELLGLIDKILPRSKSFATTGYYIKIGAILSAALGLELYIHWYREYKWYWCSLMGLLFAFVGLNIQHDANHGAVSRNPTVNRILGLSQNWIGGSAIDWIHQHVVQHHLYTNDVEKDPDIVGNDLLRFHLKSPWKKIQEYQYLYTFVLLFFFGYIYAFGSLKHNYERLHLIPYSDALKKNQITEFATFMLFFFRWTIYPLYVTRNITTLLHISPILFVGGYYLSFFFIISHQFEGVRQYTVTNPSKFLYHQAASSSNVGGSILCFFNGGLNYQIEHHLFPRICHVHYPIIAPVVRQFCESKNIPYVHFPTITENVVSCARQLYIMGSKPDPKED